MFYSKGLLSKNGPLGTIWVAAHCHKKLKKHQVQRTNISSSVDKILLYEVRVVTYRILGYLLLGLVRIYSKKVEYLFDDCRDVLTEIRHFVGSKKSDSHMDAMCAPYSSIILPDRFELDAFDLEVFEDISGGHVNTREENMLEDAGKNEEIGQSFDRYNSEEDAAFFEGYSAAYTSIEDIRSPYLMEVDMLVSRSCNLSIMEASMEKLRCYKFSLEDCLDPMILGETEEEPGLVRPFDEVHQTNGDQIKSLCSEMIFGEDREPADPIRLFDEEQQMDAEQIKFLEMTSLESEKLQTTSENHPVSITIDVTPKSKVPNASEFIAVRTPATKEPTRAFKKRKCLFDDIMVFPNNVLKQCIYDSSDLVCKRSKAPHTALHSWKAYQISNLPHSFSESLIPCVSLDLRPLICQKKLEPPEPVETVETDLKVDGLGSPATHRSPDQTVIAPSTPVTHATSLRYNENRGITGLDRVGPASSFESIEKDTCPIVDQEFDISLMNEELIPCERDGPEEHKLSVRTRTVARYLHRNFVTRKKGREDVVVNLSHVLKGKTKIESARLFYELLVLKTGGYVNAKQDNAYDDILVLETPKLKQACEADGE